MLGAIQAVAGKAGKADAVKNAVIHAKVHIGEAEEIGGFGLAVDMQVEGVDEELVQKGHEVCVGSFYTRFGIGTAHFVPLCCVAVLPVQQSFDSRRRCERQQEVDVELALDNEACSVKGLIKQQLATVTADV